MLMSIATHQDKFTHYSHQVKFPRQILHITPTIWLQASYVCIFSYLPITLLHMLLYYMYVTVLCSPATELLCGYIPSTSPY